MRTESACRSDDPFSRTLLVIVFILSSVAWSADAEVVLGPRTLRLGPVPAGEMEYLFGDGDSVSEIVALPDSEWTRGIGGGTLSLGYTDETVWVRIRLDLPAGRRFSLVDRHGLDDLTLWAVSPDGEVRRLAHGGWGLPASLRPELTPYLAGSIPAGEGPVTLLLRARNSTSMQFTLYLMEARHLERVQFHDIAFAVGLFAAVLGVGLFSLLVSIRSRDGVFAWYTGVAMIVSILLLYAGGIGPLAVWNGSVAINTIVGSSATFVAAAFFLVFTLRVLRLRTVMPVLHRVGLAAIGVQAVLLAVSPFLHVPTRFLLSNINYLVLPVAVGLCAIWLIWRRLPQAELVAIGWLSLSVAPILYGLRSLGAIGSSIALDRVGMFALAAHALVYAAMLAERMGFVRHLGTASGRDADEEIVALKRAADLGSELGVVAHELSHPVGAAMTIATMLETIQPDDSGEGAERVREAARLLTTNVERMRDLTGSVRRLAVGLSSEEWTEVILRSFLEDIVRVRQLEHKRAEHTIELICPDGLTVVTIPGFFAQIVTNLVDNAYRHAFADGDRGTITIAAEERPGGGVVITVRDDGVGMEPAVRRRIWERFFTTRGEDGGSGIGLYVVRRLVGRLGGQIEVASGSGSGTTFTVVLPARE